MHDAALLRDFVILLAASLPVVFVTRRLGLPALVGFLVTGFLLGPGVSGDVMPKRYKQALYKYADRFATEKAVQDKRPTLTDNEGRLGKLDGYEDLEQILSAACLR